MWRRKKSILVALLPAVVLVGSTACSSCAPAEGEGEESPGAPEDRGLPGGMAPPEGVPGEVP
jgi:predicted small secreted protein